MSKTTKTFSQGVYLKGSVDSWIKFWKKYGWEVKEVRPPKKWENCYNDCYIDFEKTIGGEK